MGWTRRGLTAGLVGVFTAGGYTYGRSGGDFSGIREVMEGIPNSFIDSIDWTERGEIIITFEPDHNTEYWGIWHEYRPNLEDFIVDGASPDFAGPVQFHFLQVLQRTERRYPTATFKLRLMNVQEDATHEDLLIGARTGDLPIDEVFSLKFDVPSEHRWQDVFEPEVWEDSNSDADE